MARLELQSPSGASIEVRELTTADKLNLIGDEEDLKEFILSQSGTSNYKGTIERLAEKAAKIATRNSEKGDLFAKNDALTYLQTTADFFLVCSEPQDFPWGTNIADVWFKAPEGQFNGVPDFYTYGVMQERRNRKLSDDEVKN